MAPFLSSARRVRSNHDRETGEASAWAFRLPYRGANAEVFAPESERFTASGPLVTPRNRHTATVLADGTVLIAGGLQYKLTGSSFLCTGQASQVALSCAELVR
jgi:hypothetical protein